VIRNIIKREDKSHAGKKKDSQRLDKIMVFWRINHKSRQCNVFSRARHLHENNIHHRIVYSTTQNNLCVVLQFSKKKFNDLFIQNESVPAQ